MAGGEFTAGGDAARGGQAGGRRLGARADPGGFALVIGGAFCYSFLGIFGKLAYREELSLTSLLSTRFTIGALVLWGLVALSPELRAARKTLAVRRVILLVGWGFFGFGGQSALYFSALTLISASLSEVLLYTCPAFVALILWVATMKPPAPARLAAIALALFGTYLCAGPMGDANDLRGAVLAVLGGLWYAFCILTLHRVTPGVPGILSGALIVTGAALAFDLLALFGGYHLPQSPAAWGAILGMVLCATVLGFVLFVVGLKRVGPQTTSILSTFEPLGTLLLAAVLLGERLLPAQWAGAALIIGAAFFLASSGPEQEAPLETMASRD